MAREKVLVLVMAGGAGSRMAPLTQERAKPVLPLAGVYRLIDIPLSNCVHSGLSDVWVIEQFQPHRLNDHLANGRPWDLDRTYGGLQILPPYQDQGSGESGWHQGNADAIYRNRRLIREFDPQTVLVMSADHVYTCDFGAVLAAHREQRASVTLVTTEVPRSRASRHGNLRTNKTGKVTAFAYKPEQPLGETVTAEIFAYDTQRLLETIDALVAAQADTEGETALSDFGHELIPALVEQGEAYAFALKGYWRDMGTISSYWRMHMDLLQAEPPIRLDDPTWPMRTYGDQLLPARITGTARIEDSLIAPGCQIAGSVEHAVLGPGVVVEAGAVVREAVVFGDVRIAAGARVERAILDEGVQVERGAQVGAAGQEEEEGEALDAEIAVVGYRMRVAKNAQVKPGARLAPEVENS